MTSTTARPVRRAIPDRALEQDQRYTLDVDDRRCRGFAGVAKWDLDVAACKESHLADRYFTFKQNGLKQPWRADAIWCNPPFSDIGPWVRKAWRAMGAQQCRVIAMLLPATRTEQPWWQHDVEPARDRGPRRLGASGPRVSLSSHFLPGRTRFGEPGNPRGLGIGSPPFTCVCLVFKRVQTSAPGVMA